MVTIAIPFYNGEKYLELAIQSVLAQTYTSWKLILLDDGSTDNSLAIANEYEKKDVRIKVYSDGQNKNLGYRLNQIPSLTDTKYLARMDADDIMHPKRIETQLKILETHPEIDVLGTNAYSINEYNEVEGIRVATDLNRPILIDCTTFIHPTIIAKTEWFRINPYDIKAVRVEDYELWQRTYSTSNFKVYTEPLLFYREFGKDFYKKYFNGRSSMYYVARKSNNFKNYYIAIRYSLKGIVFRIFNLLGIENQLIKKRNLPLTESRNNEASKILNQIIT